MASVDSGEDDLRFLPPSGVGDSEDVERYGPGGFHPVHLGDTYDDGRYRIVHKLGAGGFSTVWLARDTSKEKWVALKIVMAEHSAMVDDKVLKFAGEPTSAVEQRQFVIEGPNGRHLCLVLPVLGPSASQLSSGFTSRLRPWLSRKASHGAANALAGLHAQGLCHGDLTTANILFTLLDIDHLDEARIYDVFGSPVSGILETESGEPIGPEAPRYIVKAVDFLSPQSNFIGDTVRLIDFDQSFSSSSPPDKVLGIPAQFLAPEVAVGLPASPASDVWALGCCIFRLRSGEGPFADYEVDSPVDLVRFVIQTLGDIPPQWQETLWDDDGQPTRDPKGTQLLRLEGERSLKDLVYKIWDQPEGGVTQTGTTRPEHEVLNDDESEPFPSCYGNMVWKPTATKIDNVFLFGHDDVLGELLEAMPKIAEHEAALLYDLLSKIFVYDPTARPSASEILDHPWFHMDGRLD